jgi:transcriptional activator protein UGA3
MLPLFADGALELDLSAHPPAPAAPPVPFDHSPSAIPPAPQLQPPQTNFIATVLDHLPALYEYWVNSFSHVLSVLGPGHNPQVDNMFPVVQRSPLVMCALIAWAATHRANIGHPYEEVARLATEFTETQADQIDIERELTPNEREEYMWTLLILGGTEIVQGDVKGWVRRLPMTRRLLCKVVETIDFDNTLTWQALAYNCAYHDILASLTTTQIPAFPYELYNRILCANELEMDSYMGATRRIFQFLTEIAALAGKVSEIHARPESHERDAALGRIVSEAKGMAERLRAADQPSGLFKHPLPIGTDSALLLVSFYTYKLAAELYLRQTVLRCGPSDLQNRQLGVRIISNIREILGTPNESQMCFPLFLAGVATADAKGRAEVVRIFHKFSSRVQVRNVMAVLNLLYEVWKRDPDGDRYVDWRRLAEEHMDVAYSFA